MLDSSMVVNALRRLWAGSLVCRPLAYLGRSLSGRDSWIGKLLARHPPPQDLRHATRAATGSTILMLVDRSFVIVPHAWRSSKIRQLVVGQVIAPLELRQRVRATGWIVLVAAATHAALAPGFVFSNPWRSVALALFAAAGVVLVAACGPLAIAWGNWRRRTPGQLG